MREVAEQTELDGDGLGREWFLTDSNHANAALRLEGVTVYFNTYFSARQGLDTVLGYQPGLPPFFNLPAAQAALDRWTPIITRAHSLIDNALAEWHRGGPSNGPTNGADLDMWRAAWYVTPSALSGMLAELEDARVRWEQAFNPLLVEVQKARAAVGQTNSKGDPVWVPTPEQLNTSIPIDWSKSERADAVDAAKDALVYLKNKGSSIVSGAGTTLSSATKIGVGLLVGALLIGGFIAFKQGKRVIT